MPLSPRQVAELQGQTERRKPIQPMLEALRHPTRTPEEAVSDRMPERAAYMIGEDELQLEDRPTQFKPLMDQIQDVGTLSQPANEAAITALQAREARQLAKEAALNQANSERQREILQRIASMTGVGFNDLSGSISGLDADWGDTGGSSATGKRGAVIANAKKFLGNMYLWGGGHGSRPAAPNERVDCSGLVRAAFAAAKVKGSDWMNGTTYTQINKGVRAPISKLLPGDLVFSNSIGHVAIYLGNGKMIEAQRTGVPVKISPVRSGMFGLHLNY